MEQAKLNDLSGWLTVSPTSQDHFDLTAQEFRDTLALRYRKPVLNVPSGCDGCGAPFSLDNALVCRKGGLIIRRHNEVKKKRKYCDACTECHTTFTPLCFSVDGWFYG